MNMNRRTFISRTLFGMGALAAFSRTGVIKGLALSRPAQAQTRKKGDAYRRIAAEEAFAIPEMMKILGGYCSSNWDNLDLDLMRRFANPEAKTYKELIDLGEQRIRNMDENGLDMQVVSLTAPGVQMFDADTANAIATLANDRLAEAIKRHPTRFAGLAAFGPLDPKGAVNEMERAINKLKLNGFIINSHTHNEYMDDPKFWPILEAAEALDRPIYLHPRSPSELISKPYSDYGLSHALWGFQAEAGLHAMRLMLSGVFDRFPNLKIVLGHMGESIPYNIWRCDYMYKNSGAPAIMKPSEVFKRNFMITTSGVNHAPVLKYCIEVLGADNIMFAVDYPYQSSGPAVEFMNEADISREDKEKIYHRNAERVFHIAA
jgi:5-carboxyvanillate decarboxylase